MDSNGGTCPAAPKGASFSVTRQVEHLLQRMNPLNVTPPKGAKILTWKVTDLNSGGIQVGDFCTKYGMTFQWTKDHWTGTELEKLRFIGDDLCENCLEELEVKPEDDALEILLAADPNKCPASAALKKHITSFPSWYDPVSARRGQAFYRKNASFMSKMLLHMALVGGYGSAKINKVLSSTRYLIGNLDDTFRRLMETALCVTEFMSDGGLDPITGDGWKCAVRVRFLHGKVRRRLRRSQKWNTQEWGIPINQEDLTATLMAFSVSMVHASRLITGISEQEAKDFIMIWRYVGYLLGIHDENNPSNEEEGTGFLESVLFHQIQPDESSRSLAAHTLRSVENRTPEGWALPQHESLARMFMGPTYADDMAQPEMSLMDLPFHARYLAADAIYVRIIANIPFLGKKIIDTNWKLSKRGLRRILEGQTLSIYAQKKHVSDDAVGDYHASDHGKTISKAPGSFAMVKFESWFEAVAFYSVRIFLATVIGAAFLAHRKIRERKQLLRG